MEMLNRRKFANLFSVGVLCFSMSTAFGAGFCQDKLTDSDWPEDKYNYVLSCKMTEVQVGDPYRGDLLCLGSAKTQYSKYKSTKFQAYRVGTFGGGGLLDIVIQDETGSVGKDEFLKSQGSTLVFGTKNSSFESGHKWKNEIEVNLDTLKTQYNVYNYQGFFDMFEELSSSATYECTREI
jgi:hypothetical protein